LAALVEQSGELCRERHVVPVPVFVRAEVGVALECFAT
jgi:hypothetical protein